jgi:plastocyanin
VIRKRERATSRRRSLLVAAAMLASLASANPCRISAQSALGHSPNMRGEWPLQRWQTVFVFSHRFEFISGGDELINLPTLSLGMGLPARVAIGLDFTSNSEIVATKLGGNETQYWLRTPSLGGGSARLDGLVAYNTAAQSTDGALTGTVRLGPLSFIAEARAFSNVLGLDRGGAAIAGGTAFRLTRYLELSGDIGRMLEPDSLSSVWSAGVAMAIPGTPHTFSLHATNVGAVTLQSVSRRKVLGSESVRYGFEFTVPLGTRAQWASIFRRDGAHEPIGDGLASAARVEMRMVAFAPGEVRIRAGETIVWVNHDPLAHTVTADDRSWGSELLTEGQRYTRTFTQPGRYPYHCTPHPQMTGVVIVEERVGGE